MSITLKSHQNSIKKRFWFYSVVVALTQFVVQCFSISRPCFCGKVDAFALLSNREIVLGNKQLLNKRLNYKQFHTWVLISPRDQRVATNQLLYRWELKASKEIEEKSNFTFMTLTVPKPLGLILEERSLESGGGVVVKEVSESGSVVTALSNEQNVIGAVISSIQGIDVTSANFETVMDTIVNAPQIVTIEFQLDKPLQNNIETTTCQYNTGDPVTIRVTQQKQSDITALVQVGDNLRQKLIQNNVEVYTGFQKLSNCGGLGQCGLCAFDFLESDGWLERSEYEDKKLSRYPLARLTCLNNVQGPATIRKTTR